jgi:hypothetical protein
VKKHELEKLKEWTREVTRGQRNSTVFMSLWHQSMADDPSRDPVPVMQLGYAMLLDKPIVVVAPHGSRIPENVTRAARAVEFFDVGNDASLHAATLRALKAAGLEPKH